MTDHRLTVAVPWSLTHYIPLNGFHPLYRALFEPCPDGISLAAWDNIELSQRLRGDEPFRRRMIGEIGEDAGKDGALPGGSIGERYGEYFGPANKTLTRLLPGEIEFHHTAPFPSMTRPFVFHCESFAPVFFPFAHQGTGRLKDAAQLRAYYRRLFESPLCLGISSHIPETRADLSHFFASPIIDEKLFPSRIGLFASSVAHSPTTHKGALAAPVCLFINSANQNPSNFFLRGGHIALRFWREKYPEPGEARLILRCARPADAALEEHGVDLAWLRRHERKSVIWIEEYLDAAELDALMQAAHFFLLPSASLHSVSIMQAMAAGAVPIVSDTIGTSRYVDDGKDGIVLRGVRENNWQRDSDTGVLFDHYERNPVLEEAMVSQCVRRIEDLAARPSDYMAMQTQARAKAGGEFSGKHFSSDFWAEVARRYRMFHGAVPERKEGVSGLEDCLLRPDDWPRLFTSVPQPVGRLDAGNSCVTELGGCFVCAPSRRPMGLSDWSPFAEYLDPSAPTLIFAQDIKGLAGRYLVGPLKAGGPGLRRRGITLIAEALRPFPAIFSFAAQMLRLCRKGRRMMQRFGFIPPGATPAAKQEDIELISQDVDGFNIIRCGYLYYALPPSAGEFIEAKAHAGKYEICLVGTSVRDIRNKIGNHVPNTEKRPACRGA